MSLDHWLRNGAKLVTKLPPGHDNWQIMEFRGAIVAICPTHVPIVIDPNTGHTVIVNLDGKPPRGKA